jgi:hypothetical protein
MKKYIFPALLLTPTVTHAASLLTFIENTAEFLGTVVVPFLLGIAFLVFVVNVFRFFILGGHSEEGREKAKNLAIYSVAAFVFLVIFWGLVNLVIDSVGIDGDEQPCPDYIEQFGGVCP